MNLGPLTENNMSQQFLDHMQNVVEILFPDPFLTNQIKHTSGSIV